MSLPDNLTYVTVVGSLADGVDRRVVFRTPMWLVGMPFVPRFGIAATVSADGTFTVELPATDDEAWAPTNWAYDVHISIDGQDLYGSLAVPADTVGSIDIGAALNTGVPADAGDVTYLPASARGVPGGVAALNGSGQVIDGSGNPVGGGGGSSGPDVSGVLFNVEDYGAVGDGATDDYTAVKAAWDAMLASPHGGRVFFPRAVEYRVNATPGRVTADGNGAYALFKLPTIPVDGAHPKRSYGIVGVGNPYVPRTAPFSGGNGDQTMTSAVLKVTYSTPFAWSATLGLPSVIGAPDADKAAGPVGNQFWFTNLHFTMDNLTIRQPNNPSLCGLNLESVSTAEIGAAAFDVDVTLNSVAEPTHPTGAALLLPRVMNNVTAVVDRILVQGHYAGVPWVEHCDIKSAIVLRTKIAVPFRRNGYHFGHIDAICIEQCPWGFAGYDPSAAGPNLGVTAIPQDCVVKVDFCDFEDTTIGAEDWMYPPTKGAHVWDPNNKLHGQMTATRNDVGGVGLSDSMWVKGASNFAIFGMLAYNVDGSTRLDATSHAPSNPVTTPPNAPTIGAATAGNASASVAFTPAVSGSATSYTVTSTPGSLTATGSASPITVTGLTNGTAYTFKVKANNTAGSSADSAASNSVTPSGGGGSTLVTDDFNRANGALGTAPSGQAWTAGSEWSVNSNRALFSSIAAGGSYGLAVVNAGAADVTVTAELSLTAAGGDSGLAVRYADDSNFVFVDVSGSDGAGWQSKVFERIGGAFTGMTSLVSLTGTSSAAPLKIKAVASGTTITVSYDSGSGYQPIGSFTNTAGLRTNTKHGLVSESGQTTTLFDNFTVTA